MPYNHHIWKVRERAEQPKSTKASQAPSFFGKRGKSVFIGKQRASEKQSPGNDLYETAQSSAPRGSEKSPMSMNIQLPSIISPNNSSRKNPVLEEAKNRFYERQQRKQSV